MILDLLKENWTMILTFVFTFTVGIGVGAAITDAINGIKGDDESDRKLD